MTAQLRVDRDWLRAAIEDSVARYDAMRNMPATTAADRAALLAAFRSWDERNSRLLEQAFTPVAWHESSPKSDYSTLKDIEFSLLDELTEDQAPALGRLADEKKRRLESLRDSLDLYESAGPDLTATATEGATSTAVAGDACGGTDPTIFLVHGRDAAARETVHRFLERVAAARIIVLAGQPHQGQTIIEKLETHLPEAAYVVVIATADDEGRLREDADLNLRARQNVIFELGLAVGRLGRRNVAVLYEDEVELPSDYYGVGYIPFDAGGGWRLSLIGELKAAGFDVDANRALE